MQNSAMEQRWIVTNWIYNKASVETEDGQTILSRVPAEWAERICRDHNRALLLDDAAIILEDHEHRDIRIPDLLTRIEKEQP